MNSMRSPESVVDLSLWRASTEHTGRPDVGIAGRLHVAGDAGTDSQILGLGIEVEKLIGPMPPPTFRHEPI